MPTIHITTFIKAPVQRVFDLSRSIDLHKLTMSKHREEAVAGVRFGLIEKDETVTWKAKHLFKTRIYKSKISEMKRDQYFVDEQMEGDFKALKHEHHFKSCDNGTIMIDMIKFESPYGAIGKGFNKVYLTRYLRKLIEQRNTTIKEFAEGEKWVRLLNK